MTRAMYVSVPSYAKDSSTLLLLDSAAGSFEKEAENVGVGFSTANPLFGDTAMYFGTADNTALLVDSSKFNIFSGDWTIDWWECPITASSGSRFSSAYTTASGSCGGILLGYHGTAVYASTSADASNWNVITGNAMLSNTTWEWIHWAFVKSGAKLTSYRNGVKFAEAAVNATIGWSNSYKLAIGNYRAGDLDPFIGYMDMFRISKGARWTGNFTPPTKSNHQYRKVKGIYVGVAPPAGYTPVEYLQSSGTQWIDSGVSIGANTWVDADIMFDSAFDYNMMFGAWANLSASLRAPNVVCAASGGSSTQNVGSTTTTGVRYNIKVGYHYGYTQNGVRHALGGTTNAATSRHILLFAASDASTGDNPYAWSSYGVGKIYSFKIYDGDTLVRDFVPCLNYRNKEPGLYDLKNGVFYTNRGSGSFTCGPSIPGVARRVTTGYVGAALPPGYTPLDFIQSNGTQYIDTGYRHNHTTRVVMDVQATSVSGISWAFEGRISNASAAKGVFFFHGGYNTWCADYATYTNRKSFSGIASTDRLSIDFNKNSITINGSTQTVSAAEFYSTCNLTLLAANTNGSVSGFLSARLYSCKIYDNDTLIRDFVPCRNESGTCGLYDLKNNRFYGNASGKGVFTGGPENWSKAQSVARRFYEENISGIG